MKLMELIRDIRVSYPLFETDQLKNSLMSAFAVMNSRDDLKSIDYKTFAKILGKPDLKLNAKSLQNLLDNHASDLAGMFTIDEKEVKVNDADAGMGLGGPDMGLGGPDMGAPAADELGGPELGGPELGDIAPTGDTSGLGGPEPAAAPEPAEPPVEKINSVERAAKRAAKRRGL